MKRGISLAADSREPVSAWWVGMWMWRASWLGWTQSVSRWVQVSSQCSPQHLPSLFPCWWLYGVKGICLALIKPAARGLVKAALLPGHCVGPPWLPGWPHQLVRESSLVPTTTDTNAYSAHPHGHLHERKQMHQNHACTNVSVHMEPHRGVTTVTAVRLLPSLSLSYFSLLMLFTLHSYCRKHYIRK